MITRAKDALVFRAAVGHQAGPDLGAVPAPVWMLPCSAGPAGLITGTADALLRFGAMHLRDGVGLNGERVLSAQSARAMRTPEVDLAAVSTVDQNWVWAGSCLANADRGSGLAEELETLIGAELGLTYPVPQGDEPGDLEYLLGTYESVMVRLKLLRDDGRYFLCTEAKTAEAPPIPRQEIRPAGKGRFLMEGNGATVEFTHAVNGDDEYLFMSRLFKRVDR
ncbi:hypothetical protein ACIBIZ_10845 [Nonomuraea spiralis]|uniref:hypothetical protein n=1 Tax=Nonomuraea spiralis TaxID=46182 RepID=UPI003792DF31